MIAIKPTCNNCWYKEIREAGEWCYMFNYRPDREPPLCTKWEHDEKSADAEDEEEEQE